MLAALATEPLAATQHAAVVDASRYASHEDKNHAEEAEIHPALVALEVSATVGKIAPLPVFALSFFFHNLLLD